MPFDTPNKENLKGEILKNIWKRSIKEQQGEFKGSDFTVGCTTAVIDEQQITEILSKHKDKFEGSILLQYLLMRICQRFHGESRPYGSKIFLPSSKYVFATNRRTIDFGLGKKHATEFGRLS